MVIDMNINEISNTINKKYLSTEQPNFSFVNEVFAQKPYFEIVHSLESFFSLKDITDINSDVCFRYLLEKNFEKFVLELSMVGAYAVVLVIAASDNCALLQKPLSHNENLIFSSLRKNSIMALTKEELEYPYDIKLSNAPSGKTFIYHALFSDMETLPWLS
jgi:hypothetical protein